MDFGNKNQLDLLFCKGTEETIQKGKLWCHFCYRKYRAFTNSTKFINSTKIGIELLNSKNASVLTHTTTRWQYTINIVKPNSFALGKWYYSLNGYKQHPVQSQHHLKIAFRLIKDMVHFFSGSESRLSAHISWFWLLKVGLEAVCVTFYILR